MELNYKYSESIVEPSELEICKNTVYFRKDITPEEKDNEFGASVIWTYQEAILTLDEYEKLSKLSEIKNLESISQMVEKQETGDNNQLIIMEAIADLYDAIANLSGGV